MTNDDETIDTDETGGIMKGHGGGDFGLMDNFVNALLTNNPSLIITGARESLETHLAVFAAEQARKTNTVVEM
jgi:hypothetical protein